MLSPLIQGTPPELFGFYITQAGAHNSANFSYFWTKPLQSRDRKLKPCFDFSGLPALIPDLFFPVETGIGGGPSAPQQHFFYFSSNSNGNRRFSSLKLRNLTKLCVETRSFVVRHDGMCRCTSVVLFLESDVAVVGLITVQTGQIWG